MKLAESVLTKLNEAAKKPSSKEKKLMLGAVEEALSSNTGGDIIDGTLSDAGISSDRIEELEGMIFDIIRKAFK